MDLQKESADLVFSGALSVEDLVSHRFPLNEIRAGIDAFSTEQRERAEREAEEAIEAARHQGREMLDEAKSTRERVLADLFRRRGLLQAQVDELRSGRDHLLAAYRTVKRTFLEATGALAQVEARAAERATHPTDDDAMNKTVEVRATLAPFGVFIAPWATIAHAG